MKTYIIPEISVRAILTNTFLCASVQINKGTNGIINKPISNGDGSGAV
ncbi:MAG: hypothetical protein IJ609_02050 [Paludibacteraceae bacterium]|nr:hypothetical protein [Paludibacteraceae bacterium]